MTQTQLAPVTIDEDPWLSARIGYPVYRVSVTADTHEVSRIADCLLEHQPGHDCAMYYAKVNTSQVAVVSQLESAGLNVVDTNVTLSCDAQVFAADCPPQSCTIRTAMREDAAAVLRIAESCFRLSRFHLDPAVANPVADRIKHDWIKSYMNGTRGDRLFVAVHDGRPAGFLAALTTGADSDVAVIDLIGVSEHAQRRGVGRSLLTVFIEHYSTRCDTLRVGTQIANTSSLRLYQNAGFRVSDSSYVLHKHLP